MMYTKASASAAVFAAVNVSTVAAAVVFAVFGC